MKRAKMVHPDLLAIAGKETDVFSYEEIKDEISQKLIDAANVLSMKLFHRFFDPLLHFYIRTDFGFIIPILDEKHIEFLEEVK